MKYFEDYDYGIFHIILDKIYSFNIEMYDNILKINHNDNLFLINMNNYEEDNIQISYDKSFYDIFGKCYSEEYDMIIEFFDNDIVVGIIPDDNEKIINLINNLNNSNVYELVKKCLKMMRNVWN